MSQDLEERIASLEQQKRRWQWLALAGWVTVLVVGIFLLVSRQVAVQAAFAQDRKPELGPSRPSRRGRL